MSQMQLLRLFISERLSAAAEEIFAAVQRTMTEHGHSSEQHGLTQRAHLQSEGALQVFVCAHEQKHERGWSPESCRDRPAVGQEDSGLLLPEPPAIKQEQQEPWSSPERQPDREGPDTSTLKVTTTCHMTEPQNHDTRYEDREPVSNPSAEGVSPSSSECWTPFPDCSVTLTNMGPELGLETGNSASKVHAQRRHTGRKQLTESCAPHSRTAANKETKRRCKSYCCHFCGKEFSHSAHLATHSQIHTAGRPATCQVCGKEFRHGNSVAVHMRIHTEEKPYRCRICGKEFRHVGNLNVHMRIHTGEKPYSCTVCGKRFTRNNLMTKHMAVHTGEMTLSLKSMFRRGSLGLTS